MDDSNKLGYGCWIVILIVGLFVYLIGSSQKDEYTGSTTSNPPIVPPYTQPSNTPPAYTAPIQKVEPIVISGRAESPDDAYDNGYEEGYEQGLEDGKNGYKHGANYDNSNDYYNYYETKYEEGYEEGYDEGYSKGESMYEEEELEY